ncbi:Mut7-C RNAse domain-containing protein [Kistimonas scapharcae]|uniref:Mut7-C RNAse domain-containing protein n=1 Tax=Kistimonas scapharcae TaxID=1036133 RepID=UPI003CD0BF3E
MNRLRPAPLRHPRFIADVHLGRFARYLRILGLDVLYQNDYEDETIIAISQQTQRIRTTCRAGGSDFFD